MDHVALARRAFDPIGSGHDQRARVADDFRQYFDLLSAGVVLRFGVPAGTPIHAEYVGKAAVAEFFGTTFGGLVDEVRSTEPLEYIGAGSKVVILGREDYRIVKTGTAVKDKAFAVELEFGDGLIVRDTQIRDLMEFVDIHRHG